MHVKSIKQTKQIFQKHARTFSFAAKMLPQHQYEAVSRLYAFCRYLDDIADQMHGEQTSDRLINIHNDLTNGSSKDPYLNDFMALRSDYNIPLSAAFDLVEGLIADTHPRHLLTHEDLIRYAYSVASTVGIMMCSVLEVKSDKAIPYAIDLGIAMQLTNICRDVLEDCQRDRIYLPQEYTKIKLETEKLLAGDEQHRLIAWNTIIELLSLANQYYQSAELGMRYIPYPARLCVRAAANMYEEIGNEILTQPKIYWCRRAHVKTSQKIYIILRTAMSDVFKNIVSVSPNKAHNAKLHEPLSNTMYS